MVGGAAWPHWGVLGRAIYIYIFFFFFFLRGEGWGVREGVV